MTGAEFRSHYEATRYLVHHEGKTVETRIGQPSRELDALLKKEGARGGVFITAFNPRSEPRSAAENRAANRALAESLRAWRTLPHEGVALDGSWSEEGFFVLDLPRVQAVALAERFDQNAIVLCELGRAPVLIFTREAKDGSSG